MKSHVLDEQELFPPFNGFPPEGLAFLRKLRRNNNRPWFQRHKQEYEEFVRFPMQCLVAELGQRMADIAPELEFSPRRSIFRIYRDVRFSKNKAPYKTNVAASFDLRGHKSPTETPGLYVGIEPGEIFIGGGLYMPTGAQLKAIRRTIVDQPERLRAIVDAKEFQMEFGAIMGEKLQRAPLGYPKDHAMIDYLTFKQFYVGKELGEAACLKPGFVDLVERVLTAAMPFVRWLTDAAS